VAASATPSSFEAALPRAPQDDGYERFVRVFRREARPSPFNCAVLLMKAITWRCHRLAQPARSSLCGTLPRGFQILLQRRSSSMPEFLFASE